GTNRHYSILRSGAHACLEKGDKLPFRPVGKDDLAIARATPPGTPPWPRPGYRPRRRSGPCDGTRTQATRPMALLRPLWRGRLAAWPNVRLPIPIAAFRAQGRFSQLSVMKCHHLVAASVLTAGLASFQRRNTMKRPNPSCQHQFSRIALSRRQLLGGLAGLAAASSTAQAELLFRPS